MSPVALRSPVALCWLIGAAAAAAAATNTPPITLEVDARDVSHAIQHAHLTIPVRPGPLTLAYPKWIPGEHAPDGPLTQLVALEISAAGRTLPWRRDPLDAFLFRLEVPPGAGQLDVRFDYLSPPAIFADGYGRTPNMTPHLLVLPFNHFILYPSGTSVEALTVKASVRLPEGWKADGALSAERSGGDTLVLPPVSLYTLIDSPILAGEYFRSVTLTSGAAGTRVSIAADAPGDLAVSDATLAGLRRLAPEAVALFGPPHYREYVWLIALGNTLDQNGLEHHESTDIRENEGLFTDSLRSIELRTIAHEYVHSWNGKYRRPAGLATRNYQEPMVDDLLWVYEGMTRYYGDLVLRTRSGLATPAQTRDYLAVIAATADADRPGRTWRSLGDTATALPGYNDAPPEWSPIRRRRDYYDEMGLVWLDADTLIRESSRGTRSLDDFSRRFFAGPERAPAVRPYSRAEVITTLSAVQTRDWQAFLRARVDDISPRAPLEGISRGGWTLVYDDAPNEALSARDKVEGTDNLSLSLGLWAKPDGTVADVVHGSPVFAAGMAPGMRLISIGGRKWSGEAAREALTRAEKSTGPLELIVSQGDLVRVLHVEYHGGLRNPHLVRDAARADLLSEILAPRASASPSGR
jgi:predicted metalloprotease with PDZ domain